MNLALRLFYLSVLKCQKPSMDPNLQVHRCRDERVGAGGDRACEERAAAVQRRPRGVRQRQDQQERQLVPLRKVHGHQL